VTPEVWLLVGWILVGAAFLVVHLVTLWLCIRASNLTPAAKVIALIPPATPVVAWRSGLRFQPILWAVLGALYVGLRFSFEG